MSKILIIDDDLPIGNMLEEALAREGYRILRAYSGTEALYVLDRERPDLVLLDLMLPGLNGEELLPRIAGIPVIVVSAKADVESKASLLLGGAADYVTKPFELKELLARIAVQIRAAARNPEVRSLRFESLVLDPDTRTVSLDVTPGNYGKSSAEDGAGGRNARQYAGAAGDRTVESGSMLCDLFVETGTAENGPAVRDLTVESGGKMRDWTAADESAAVGMGIEKPCIRLTRTEFAILKLLMQNPGQVLPKSLLLERISEDTPDCTESSLKMHVSNLRKKLRELDGRDYIEAVWGIGFRLRPAAEK